jgi:Condensation domain
VAPGRRPAPEDTVTQLADLDTPIVRRTDGSTDVPLSVLQERMYHLCTSYPGTSSPIMYLCWRLRGPLDVDAWTRAAASVVDRHESLRTTFPTGTGAATARIAAASGLGTERVDLSTMPAGEREAHATEMLSGRVRALLDLAGGPLVASTLIDFADDDHVWCFTVHHLLADGTSLGLLSRDMRAFYAAYATGTDVDLPALSIGYGDFATWQQRMSGLGEADALAYWLDRLSGVPFLELPTDAPRPPEKGTRIEQLGHVLSGDLAERLERYAASAGATLFMVLLAGITALFTLESGQEDVCIGTLVAGRDRPETRPVVGLFYNTLALRCDTGGNPTFGELVDRTKMTSLDAFDRANVPFGRIVTALDVPRDLSRTQVFQSMFILHTEQEAGVLDVADLHIDAFLTVASQSIHDLVLHAWRTPDALTMDLRFDRALFEPETIARMAARFETMLRAGVDDPQIRLFEMAMLPDA